MAYRALPESVILRANDIYYIDDYHKVSHTTPYLEPVTPRDPVHRNDPCPCGSTRKYKKCCLKK